jgi:hypothetical protein
MPTAFPSRAQRASARAPAATASDPRSQVPVSNSGRRVPEPVSKEAEAGKGKLDRYGLHDIEFAKLVIDCGVGCRDHTMRLFLRIAVWVFAFAPFAGSLAAQPLLRSVLVIDEADPVALTRQDAE